LIIPATDEAIHCWATGKRIIGTPIQMIPRKAIRGRSSRATGERARGNTARAAAPSSTRLIATTPGCRVSSPRSISRNDEPQMREQAARRLHSTDPKAAVRVPLPPSISLHRDLGRGPGVASATACPRPVGSAFTAHLSLVGRTSVPFVGR